MGLAGLEEPFLLGPPWSFVNGCFFESNPLQSLFHLKKMDWFMSFLLHGKSPHLAVINHFLDLQHFCPFLIIGVLFNA